MRTASRSALRYILKPLVGHDEDLVWSREARRHCLDGAPGGLPLVVDGDDDAQLDHGSESEKRIRPVPNRFQTSHTSASGRARPRRNSTPSRRKASWFIATKMRSASRSASSRGSDGTKGSCTCTRAPSA